MTFAEDPKPPLDHPITPIRAKELVAGDLGNVYRDILSQCVAPLYWHGPDSCGNRHICSNGSMTFVQTPERVFGVTAAHVLKEYTRVKNEPGIRCQLMNAWFDAEVIDESESLDLATVAIKPELIAETGKEVIPVTIASSGDTPQEGRGIMLAGYPGQERRQLPGLSVEWGLFTALGVARRVNVQQITWIPDREHHVPVGGQQMPPPNQGLGGISGGPLIAWYENAAGLTYYSLAGVIVEASAALENVVAIRSEFICPDGSICRA